MSRTDPRNREEAFTYQFEDDAKLLRQMSYSEEAFEKALNILEIHISAYRNKNLRKRVKKSVKKYNENRSFVKKHYPSLLK